LRRTVLIASAILVVIVTVALLATTSINNKTREEKRWRVCTVYLIEPFTHRVLGNFTVYWAWNEDLMREGYRYKDSYDFLNQSAIGMLFLFNNMKYGVHVTMKDVKLPLHAVFFSTYHEFQPVEEISNVAFMQKVWEANLEPGKEYVVNLFINAIIEFDPQAYSKLIRVCQTSSLFNYTYCHNLDDYIKVDLDKCYEVG